VLLQALFTVNTPTGGNSYTINTTHSTAAQSTHYPSCCCQLCVLPQALFTVDLPPGGKLPPGHRPVCSQATIQGMRDEVIVMSSLMKPKKITFIGR
jgi:hypothetical protein